MMLDTHIVAVNMYQRNALTLKELQTVQSLRDRPVEAAEMLLNIILEQPDAVYLCFLDVLKHAGQHHVYQTLVEGGYKGEYFAIVAFYASEAMRSVSHCLSYCPDLPCQHGLVRRVCESIARSVQRRRHHMTVACSSALSGLYKILSRLSAA